MLEGEPDSSPPSFTDGAVEVRALGGDWLGDAATLPEAVAALLGQVDGQQGYLAVMAYLDRLERADLAEVRSSLAHRVRRPVTFGLGAAVPALDGPVPQGRPRRGRLPADHRRARRGPRRARQGLHLRPADLGPGRR